MSLTLIKGGHIVTQNKLRQHFVGDVLIQGERIKEIQKKIDAPSGAKIVDAQNRFVIPGLIQTHTHLCQVLFRGMADDLALLDWLQKRIWPLEAAHNASSLRASAELGLLEMQSLGTTSILDMGTVRHTDSIFSAADAARMRYWGGKCLMDVKKYSGPLYEDTASSLNEMQSLIKKWHKKTALLEYAICPRFALSTSEGLLRECVRLQKKHGVLIHTHASENKDEVSLVKKITGKRNIDYFDHLKLLNNRTVIAHGIHMSDAEIKKFIRKKAGLAHCPSSNLKLASGIATIAKYLKMKMRIGLGSDGAPCNNTMDPFAELRLAALLQKPIFGPKALPATQAFDLATIGGATVLGRQHDLGSIEVGKLADLALVSREHPSVSTVTDPYSALVYSVCGRDVTDVMIHGDWVVKNRVHQFLNAAEVQQRAAAELSSLMTRVKT